MATQPLEPGNANAETANGAYAYERGKPIQLSADSSHLFHLPYPKPNDFDIPAFVKRLRGLAGQATVFYATSEEKPFFGLMAPTHVPEGQVKKALLVENKRVIQEQTGPMSADTILEEQRQFVKQGVEQKKRVKVSTTFDAWRVPKGTMNALLHSETATKVDSLSDLADILKNRAQRNAETTNCQNGLSRLTLRKEGDDYIIEHIFPGTPVEQLFRDVPSQDRVTVGAHESHELLLWMVPEDMMHDKIYEHIKKTQASR